MLGSRDLLYDIPTWMITLVLLTGMLAIMAAGYLLGHKRRPRENEETKSQTTAVQGSMLGLLALLLGFTFSLALTRHDTRSNAVVAEANAIGTAWLRTDLLPPALREDARTDLRRYVELRVASGAVTADHHRQRKELVEQANAVFMDLWRVAAQHAETSRSPAAAAYVTSLNDMIDALGERDAAIERHVPEVVLMMLFVTFLLSGAMLGFTSGLSGAAPAAPVYLMLILIVLLVFMIVDLDRPRRGLIEVDQSSMTSLVESMREK